MKDHIVPDEDFMPCGDDYVETVGSVVMELLRQKGYRRGVRVSINRQLALVQIGVPRPIAGFYEQTTDCQAAFDAHLEPQFVAASAVAELVDNLQRAKSAN